MSNDQTKSAQSIEEAAKNPKNLGEMENADAVGTVGRSDCGDMLRMWVKFKEEDEPVAGGGPRAPAGSLMSKATTPPASPLR